MRTAWYGVGEGTERFGCRNLGVDEGVGVRAWRLRESEVTGAEAES